MKVNDLAKWGYVDVKQRHTLKNKKYFCNTFFIGRIVSPYTVFNIQFYIERLFTNTLHVFLKIPMKHFANLPMVFSETLQITTKACSLWLGLKTSREKEAMKFVAS